MADTAAPAKEHAGKPAPPKLLEGAQLVDHRDGRDVVMKLRGVRTQFGDNIIHDNLDFDVFRGEIIGLVGGSGTGKSVLLRTIIGCFEGLQVRGSAESVGQLTTKSVVESIFCVIVLDAIFSIIFLLAGV